ncbi:MAG: NADPH-dependent glutamate synthase [bacterium]|nr:NADPH-dependent glutamate synthase [bacterium]
MSDSRKTGRVDMPRQPASVRVRNFDEVALGYSEEDARREAGRCIQCKNPLCVQGCPVDIDIPRFILQIREGDEAGAAATLKLKNSLPAVCGRVCPQEEQCEKLCILGKKGQPVAIGRLERYAADRETAAGQGSRPGPAGSRPAVTRPSMASPTGRSVAVIGAGPSGLAAAGELAKLGHRVTVFEALHKPGGVLVYGIPEFRLPKAIVEQECDFIRSLGVEIRCNYVIGRSGTVDELLRTGFDAVFVGTGAGLPYFMNIPGENLNGVYSSNEFLTRVNLMKAYRFPEYDTPVHVGRNVAVIGGGNVAMDAARCSLRLGAETVHLVYRRGREQLPAREEEIENAFEEGVRPVFLTVPVEILGDENGWVKGLECIRMELGEPDASGRQKPVPVAGSNHILEADTVIMAIGQGPNPLLTLTTPDLKLNKWGYIVADEATGQTSKKGVFAGGDIVTGAATVILAMGAGKKAAMAIHKYLQQDRP